MIIKGAVEDSIKFDTDELVKLAIGEGRIYVFSFTDGTYEKNAIGEGYRQLSIITINKPLIVQIMD